ncbi:extracellular solute-binding protein [Faecalicatena acetigenes]|uniref:Extracellular solute-binding protein n=1 Tax=Faecalicatena acetigenes TaxID=2981790 RepID=A0ABT2TDM6_9FIRM|nr:extracellular solute-binding protein [Faecalicatena acetigenes]
MIQYNANTVSDLMEIGDVFVNLEDYADILDTSDFNQEFIQNFSYYDGKMIALPTGINGGIWLTNTQLLDEAGMDAETIKTWDDFIEAGKTLHETNENYYLFNIDIETLGKELLGSIMAQITGEDLINKDTMEINFTKEDLKKAFTLIDDMYRNNVIEPAADSAPYALKLNTNPKWINHELALVYGATSNIFDGYYDFQNTAIALDMPEFEDAKESGILYVPPQMLAISSKCEHPEVAADFLNYFYNNETAINTLKTCRSLPATEKGRQICEEEGYADPVLISAIEKAEETGTIHQNLYTPTEVVEILQDGVEKIAYGQGDVESITNDTMSLLEETLERLQK